MTTSDLKLELFRKIDGLKERNLKEAYGVLLNYINKTKTETWEALTQQEKEAIEKGIVQLDRGEGIPHEEVISKHKKKYGR